MWNARWAVQIREESVHAACMVTIQKMNGWLGEEAGNKKSGDCPKAQDITLLESNCMLVCL